MLIQILILILILIPILILIHQLAMTKRTAGEAGLTWESSCSQVFRMDVHIPPDRVTKEQPTQIHLILCIHGTVLQARQILTYRIKEIIGKVPELQAFFLEQNRRRLCDLSPVTSTATLQPVLFVRTAPDSQFRQHRQNKGSSIMHEQTASPFPFRVMA